MILYYNNNTRTVDGVVKRNLFKDLMPNGLAPFRKHFCILILISTCKCGQPKSAQVKSIKNGSKWLNGWTENIGWLAAPSTNIFDWNASLVSLSNLRTCLCACSHWLRSKIILILASCLPIFILFGLRFYRIDNNNIFHQNNKIRKKHVFLYIYHR